MELSLRILLTRGFGFYQFEKMKNAFLCIPLEGNVPLSPVTSDVSKL